jgi:hypothetical protein
MIYYTVTTYDDFGNVAGTYKAKDIGWFKHGAIVLTLKGDKKVTIRMPSIIVEIPRVPDHMSCFPSEKYPHNIILYSLDNKIIKSWISEYAPALPEFGALFDTKESHVEIHGSYVINKIDSPNNEK